MADSGRGARPSLGWAVLLLLVVLLLDVSATTASTLDHVIPPAPAHPADNVTAPVDHVTANVDRVTAPTDSSRQHIRVSPFQEYGVVSPDDPFRFEGQSVQITCSVAETGPHAHSGNLLFVRKTTQGEAPLGKDLVQVLDTLSISLTLPSVQVADEGTYTCLMRRADQPVEDYTVIGHQILTVDYPPQPVQNVTCEIYNWAEMTCTWRLGVAFKHPEKVKVDVDYQLADEIHRCPMVSKTSCRWDERSFHDGHLYWLQVTVTYLVAGQDRASTQSVFTVATNSYDTSAFDSLPENVTPVQAL
ncbi:hypothetical protein EGW08_016910, partial [Elysia chlorotica]